MALHIRIQHREQTDNRVGSFQRGNLRCLAPQPDTKDITFSFRKSTPAQNRQPIVDYYILKYQVDDFEEVLPLEEDLCSAPPPTLSAPQPDTNEMKFTLKTFKHAKVSPLAFFVRERCG